MTLNKEGDMFIFNTAGGCIAVIGFTIAFGIGSLVGQTEEGPLMIIAGVVIALVDSAYRWKSEDGHWLLPERGGSMFFVPAWAIGIIWLALGIVYAITPRL